MSGPPNDIDPGELWTLIASEKRPFEIVDFPRSNPATGQPLGKLAIWPLKQSEITVAKAEATRKARALIREKFDQAERVEGYAQVYEDVTRYELIFRFCRRHDNTDLPVFPTSQHVADKLTSDECAVLIEKYAIVQVKLGPIISQLSDAECEAWIARLREGGSRDALYFLSWEGKNDLIMYMASRSSPSQTAKSLPTSPPDEPISSD